MRYQNRLWVLVSFFFVKDYLHSPLGSIPDYVSFISANMRLKAQKGPFVADTTKTIQILKSETIEIRNYKCADLDNVRIS